jgi:acetyl/propionyl-CoA carboxylase alpha subunit
MKRRPWTSRGVHSYCGMPVWKNGRIATTTSGPLGQGEKGTPILTLVIKMKQTLRAPFAGVLRKIKCKVGEIVQEGVELAEVEPT